MKAQQLGAPEKIRRRDIERLRQDFERRRAAGRPIPHCVAEAYRRTIDALARDQD